MYNTGLQVLGVLLERAAGQPLPELLDERVCGPLGMVDTGFHVPPAAIGPVDHGVRPDRATGARAARPGRRGELVGRRRRR